MAKLKLNHIYKVYDNGVKAVNDFSIDIADKEFIVFVGPSGCGKSTTLRMIAGLEEITAGDLFIGDTLVNDLEPKDRDIAMVFQNYALYPHMSVYENMAFGLKNQHMPHDEINRRVLEAAKILDIEEYLERKPKAMSGGQRQRVALGRAIVREPKVFLLDEPLSNLDAKLRAQMRTEITKLHKKLGTTFIYVTHDQVEAMTMGTRIVVMKNGFVQQIDTPLNLYDHPANKFVAGFIGTPQMNFFNSKMKREDDKVSFILPGDNVFEVDYEKVSKINSDYLEGRKGITLGIRPDAIKVVKKGGIKARVNQIERLGNESILYGQLDLENTVSLTSTSSITIKLDPTENYEIDEIINVTFDQNKLHLFDLDSELSIIEDIPNNKIACEVKSDKVALFNKEVKLPVAFEGKLNGLSDIDFLIPPTAAIKGKTFSLEVEEIEEIDGKYLGHFRVNNNKVFFLLDETYKVGDTFKFDLLFDRIAVYQKFQEVIVPISETASLNGRFIKTKEKVENKKQINFYLTICGARIPVSMDKVAKITTIEGQSCFKKEYKYVFDRHAINTNEAVISGEVTEVVDYGHNAYARVKLADQELLVLVDRDFKEQTIGFTLADEDISIYQREIDMRIC